MAMSLAMHDPKGIEKLGEGEEGRPRMSIPDGPLDPFEADAAAGVNGVDRDAR